MPNRLAFPGIVAKWGKPTAVGGKPTGSLQRLPAPRHLLMAERNLMAVRTELVQETMVARLVELVRAEPGAGPESLRSTASSSAAARKRWRGRQADHDAVARVAHDLASREPLGRPEPNDENAAETGAGS
jgi:hypothetical protein